MQGNSLYATQLIQEGLLSQIKPAIERDISDKLIEDFKSKMEPIVKEAVERLTLEGITHLRDLYKLRDEFVLSLEWEKDNGRKS